MYDELLRIVELSGELEIGLTTGDDASHGAWYGFTWYSGYVYGDTPFEVLHEILLESKYNGMQRLPVVQITQRESYLRRHHERK